MSDDRQTIISLLVDVRAKAAGIKEVEQALDTLASDLQNQYKSVATSVDTALNTISKNFNQIQKQGGETTKAFIESLANVQAQLLVLKDTPSFFVEELKAVLALVSGTEKSTKALENLRKTLQSLEQTPKTPTELLNWLKMLNSTIHQVSQAQYLKSSPIGEHLGEGLVNGLRKMVNPSVISEIFKAAFSGNVNLLEPLRKALGGDTAFLSVFSSYVKKSFEDSYSSIEKSVGDSAKQLTRLGELADLSSSGVANLRGGFVEITKDLRNAIGEFEVFDKVQATLNSQLNITDDTLNKSGNQFLLYQQAAKQAASTLSSLEQILGKVNPIPGVSDQLDNYKTYVELIGKVESRLKTLREAQNSLSRMEGSGLGVLDPNALKKAQDLVSSLVGELSGYSAQLGAFDTTKLQNTDLLLKDQKVQLQAVIADLVNLNSKSPVELQRGISALTTGLVAAVSKTDDMFNRFGRLGTETTNLQSRVSTALSNAVGNLGNKLLTQIQQAAHQAEVQFSNVRIPPIELKNLSLADTSRTHALFGQLSGLITNLHDQWDAFSKQLKDNGVLVSSIDLLHAAISTIAPVLSDLKTKPQEFGKAFNSTTSEAQNNLIALETVLKLLSEDVLKVGDAFAEPIKSVRHLREELSLIDVAKPILDSVSESASRISVGVQAASRTVSNLVDTVSKMPNKISPDFVSYKETVKDVGALDKRLNDLISQLRNLKEAENSFGGGTFQGSLRVTLGFLETSLLKLKDTIAKELSTPLENLKLNHIDESLSTTNKEFTVFGNTAKKAIDGVASSLLGLDDSHKVFNNIQNDLSKFQTRLANPSEMLSWIKLLTSISTKFSTGLSDNFDSINSVGVKEATTNLRQLVSVVKDYLTAQLASAKLKIADEKSQEVPNQGLIDTLNKQSKAYETLVKNLTAVDVSLESTQDKFTKTKNTIELSTKAAQDIIQPLHALQQATLNVQGAGNQWDSSAILRSYEALSTGSSVAVKDLDKLITKVEELEKAQYQLPKDTIFKTDENGAQVAFTSLKEYISYLRDVRTQAIDFVNSQKEMISPLTVLKRVFDELHSAAKQSISPDLTGADRVVAVFETTLKQVINDFHTLTSGVSNFADLQVGYTRHKEGLSELFNSLQTVISALKQLEQETPGVEVSFGGAMVSAKLLAERLTETGQQISKESTSISVALQAGGKSLNDFLLTEASGSRFSQMSEQFTDLTNRVNQAVSAIGALGRDGAEISVSDVSALKTTITSLVRERAALAEEIRGGIERMQSGLRSAESTLGTLEGRSTQDVDHLRTSVQAAIAQFEQLSTALKNAQVSYNGQNYSSKDITNLVGPVLEFNSALAKMDEQLSRINEPTTQFDFHVLQLVEDLKITATQLGRTQDEFSILDRAILQSHASDLSTRYSEVKRTLIEVTKAINAMELASKNGVGPIVSTQELESAKNKAEELKLQMVELAQAGRTLQAVMKIQPDDNSAIKNFTAFGNAAKKSLSSVASSLLSLESSHHVFNTLQTDLAKFQMQLANPSEILSWVTQLTSVANKFSTELNNNFSSINNTGAKEATTNLRQLVSVVREYITAQLASARLKIIDEKAQVSPDEHLIGTLIKQSNAYKILVNVLSTVDSSLETTQTAFSRTKNVIELSTKATQEIIEPLHNLQMAAFRARGITNQWNISNILQSFDSLSTGSAASIRDLDKLITKVEELEKAQYQLPKDTIFKTDLNGNQVAFTSLKEYIDYLKDIKTQSIDFVNSQKEMVAPLEAIKRIFDELRSASKSSIDPNLTGVEQSVAVFETTLKQVINDFHALTAGVNNFADLQVGYTRHKEGLAELFNSVQTVITVLKQLEQTTPGVEVSFGGAMVSAKALTDRLAELGQQISKESTSISVALQAGGKSLNDFLLTEASSSRFTLMSNQLSDLTARINQAVSAIGALGRDGAEISVSDVSALKTTITSLVRERAALAEEIRSGIERMQSGLRSAESTLGTLNGQATHDVDQLRLAVHAAVAQFEQLSTALKNAQVSYNGQNYSSKDITNLVGPVLEFNSALSKMGEQLSRINEPTTQFDQHIATLVSDLKIAETQLGLTQDKFSVMDKVLLQSHASDLSTRFNEVKQTLIEVTRAINSMEMAAKNNVGPTVNTQELDTAKTKAEQLKQQMFELAQAGRTLQAAMKLQPEGTNAIANLGRDVESSAEKIKGAGALLSKFMQSVFETAIKGNAEFKAMGANEEEIVRKTRLLAAAVQEIEQKFVTSLRSMDMMAMGLQMLGQAMVEPFKAATDSFIKFSDTMAFVKGTTKSTESQMEEMSNAALVIGSTTRTSALQAADGLKQLALAGYNTEQSIAVLPTVVRLAQAAEMQLGSATEIVVNIMNSQKISTENIAGAADILTAAANSTTSTISDLGTAFKYIGPLAGTLQNDFADTTAAVALLHNAGLKGSMAGTALRGALQALLNPTKDEAANMERLSSRLGGVGLQVLDSQGKFVGFKRIIEQFEDAGISTAEVLQLFGQRAGPGMAALLQMGSDKLDSLVNKLETASGTTSLLSENMEATLGGSFDKLKNSLESFGEVVGHAIAGPLGTVADIISNVAQKMVEFGNEFPIATAIISQFSGAVAIAFLALGSMAMTWTMMLVPARQLFSFMRTMVVVMLETTAVLNGMKAAFAAQFLMNISVGKSFVEAAGATNKFSAALTILRTILSGFMTALMNPLTPWGAAAWALTLAVGAAAAAYMLLKRDLGIVNAEFVKNREIITNNVQAFRGLRDQVVETANAVTTLSSLNKGLSTDQFINLTEFKQQKDKLLQQFAELRDRFKESPLSKDVKLLENIDSLTGKMTGFTLVSRDTFEVLGHVDASMLSTAGGAQELIKNMEAINAQMALAGAKQTKDSVLDQLAENLSRSAGDIKKATGDAKEAMETDLVAKKMYLDKLAQANEKYLKVEEYNRKIDEASRKGDMTKYLDLEAERVDFLQKNKQFFDAIQLQNLEASDSSAPREFLNQMLKQTIEGIAEEEKAFADGRSGLVNAIKIFISATKDIKPDENVFKDYFKQALEKSKKFKFFDAYSQQDIKDMLPDMVEIWKTLKNEMDVGSKSVDFNSSLEPMFRGIQQQVDSFTKMMDEAIKELTTQQEDLKKVLDKYQKSADIFSKVRNDFVTAAKAKLDIGLSESERKLTESLDNIVAQSYTSYGKVAEASISWVNPATTAADMEARKFAAIQDIKTAVASSAAGKMYNVFTTSLQKQIDDLERESKVVSNIFTIPLRMESEQPFGSFTFKNYVAGGNEASRALFEYQITINKKLIEAELYQQQKTLALKKQTIESEIAQVKDYYAQVSPKFAKGTEDRINLDKEVASKQKELYAKGVEAAKSALDKLYAYHKQISDKIKTVEENQAKFLAGLDDSRRKVLESGQNEFQVRDNQFTRIADMFKTAQDALGSGQYDKALEAFKKIKELADSVQYEAFDNETKRRLLNIFDDVEKGSNAASAGITQNAKTELVTVENLGKSMQENLKGFEEGVNTFGQQLEQLAQQLENLKVQFGKDHKVNLDSADAVAKFTELEKHVLMFKRMLDVPIEVNMTDEKLQELNQQVNESIANTIKLQALYDAKQDLKPLQQRIDKTNDLLALERSLQEATKAFSRTPTTSKTIAEGTPISDINEKDINVINKALKDREVILEAVVKSYQATGSAIPAFVQQELDAIRQARVAFADGKEDSVGFSTAVKEAFERSEEATKFFSDAFGSTSTRVKAAITLTANAVLPTLEDMTKKLKELDDSKNFNLSSRATVSTNVNMLFGQLQQLSKQLNEKQTTAALDVLIQQMQGYKKSIQESADAGDEASKANIKYIDADIAKLEELKKKTTLTNQQKIDEGKKVSDEMTKLANEQQAAQEASAKATTQAVTVPVAANKQQATQAGTDAVKDAQTAANTHPVELKLKTDAQQAASETARVAKQVEDGFGIAWGGKAPKVMVQPTVDQSALNQAVDKVENTAKSANVTVPIQTNQDQVNVAAKDIELLRYKLLTLMQANTSFKLFDGNQTTQQVNNLIKPLDALLATKDQLGNVKITLGDQSIANAAKKFLELNTAAQSYLALIQKDRTNVFPEMKQRTTSVDDFNTRLYLAMQLVKKASDTPLDFKLNVEDPTTAFNNIQQGLKSVQSAVLAAANQSEATPIEFSQANAAADHLNQLQTKLAQLQQQAASGVPLNVAQIDAFRTDFVSTMEQVKAVKVNSNDVIDGAAIDQQVGVVNNAVGQLKANLSAVPSITVDAEHSKLDEALEKTKELLGLDHRTATIDIITNLISRQQSGGSVGYQTGGLISHFAEGGLSTLQRLADGGKLLFKRIINKVPGVGFGDKVPAMLEPGEYVVRRAAVQQYGTGFMEKVNQGLIQFRAIGGSIFNLPSQALTGLQQYVTQQYPFPDAVASGPSVDVRLHLGDKVFNMKSPRNQVKDLVNAVKSLDRGY